MPVYSLSGCKRILTHCLETQEQGTSDLPLYLDGDNIVFELISSGTVYRRNSMCFLCSHPTEMRLSGTANSNTVDKKVIDPSDFHQNLVAS